MLTTEVIQVLKAPSLMAEIADLGTELHTEQQGIILNAIQISLTEDFPQMIEIRGTKEENAMHQGILQMVIRHPIMTLQSLGVQAVNESVKDILIAGGTALIITIVIGIYSK